MSSTALGWALDARRSGTMGAEQRIVLLALADYADDLGQRAFPSVARLTVRLGMSERAVRRALASLEDAGIIRRGDQQHVAHYRADRRPVVWELGLNRPPRGATGGTPQPDHEPARGAADDMSSVTERGATDGRHGVPLVAPNTRTRTNNLTTPPLPPSRSRPPERKPTWCGVCDPGNRLRYDDAGTASRCWACHPLTAHPAPAAQPRLVPT